MNTKTKSIVVTVIVFIAGYVLGGLLGWPIMSSESGSGNISMVSKFHKNTVSPAMSAYQEKLLNDPNAFDEASRSLAVIASRMAQFNALVDVAMDATKDVPELANYMQTLQSMKSVSENAEQNGKDAINSFDQTFLQKNGAATDYEQASQKLTLAYLLVDRQMSVAKEYVAAVDKVISNNPESNLKLAAARDLWANYCAGNAYINNDTQEQGWWEKQTPLLTDEQLGAVFAEVKIPVATLEPLGWVSDVNSNFNDVVIVRGLGQDVRNGFAGQSVNSAVANQEVKAAAANHDVKAAVANQEVKAAAVAGKDVKAAVANQEVRSGFGSQAVRNGFATQNVKAGFAEQNVKAALFERVKAGFGGQEFKNGFIFQYDVNNASNMRLRNSASQDVKAGFAGGEVRNGFVGNEVKAGYDQMSRN